MHERLVERKKAVAETSGDEQLAVIARAQLEALPEEIRRRFATQVDDDVEDTAVQALHEFRHVKIVVQPAHDVARRARGRVLRPLGRQTELGVLRCRPRLFEKPARVVVHVGNEEPRVRK